MYVKIEIAFPYSVREVFDTAAHARLSSLRSEALSAFEGNKKQAWHYLSAPRNGWGNENSLFRQSLSSAEGHENAMNAIGQMVHGGFA